jgi:hypothetical protein
VDKASVDFSQIAPPRFVTLEEAAAGDEQAKLRAVDERRRWLLTRHIPAKDVEALLHPGTLKPTESLRKVRAWLVDPSAPRILVLSGDPDSCKTTAAAWAVAADPIAEDRRWLREGAPSGRYIEAELLFGAWIHVAPKSGPDGIWHDREVVSGMNRGDLVACALLAIDDMGQESGKFTPEVGEAFETIVRLRCDRLLRTLATTNEKTPEDLAKRYGDRGQRLLERLTEHALWVDCPVEGFRTEQRRADVLKARGRART